MTLELTDFKASYVVDGAVILFTKDPDIQTIERVENLLKNIANDLIRASLERDL